MGSKTISPWSKDFDQLLRVQEKLLKIQKSRIEEKYPEYGGYQDWDPKNIMENLGKNVVQFAMAYEGDPDEAMKEGADIINLILMALDNIIVPD